MGTHTGMTPLLRIGRPGQYYLFMVLDATNAVAESDESNNVGRSSGQVTVSGPVGSIERAGGDS